MNTLLTHARGFFAAAMCTALAACQTTTGTQTAQHGQDTERAFCEERPAVCALIGTVIIGGVVTLASNSGGGAAPAGVGAGGGGGGNAGSASDVRLKSDIRFVEQLENGINLYAFRYTGDDRVFVGVNAAEILADPRHAHAVVDLGNDLLGVDYQALGLKMVNEIEMRAAGQSAIARASAS